MLGGMETGEHSIIIIIIYFRWILDINPSGTCNVLGCLKYCMEDGIISKNC